MKAMRTFVMGAALMVGSVMCANAQEQKPECKAPSAEEMMEMQALRMAERLVLDDATTAKFTPVYVKYLTELRSLAPEGGCPEAKEGKKGEKGERPACAPEGCPAPQAKEGCPAAPQARKTDADVEAEIKARFATARKLIDIQEVYYKELRKFLSPKQVEKVLFAKDARHPQGGKKGDKKGGQPCPQGGQPQGQPQGRPCPQGGQQPMPAAEK